MPRKPKNPEPSINNPDNRWLNLEQFAKMSGLTLNTIEEYVFRKKLLSENMGGTRMIPFFELEKYLKTKAERIKKLQKQLEQSNKQIAKIKKSRPR